MEVIQCMQTGMAFSDKNVHGFTWSLFDFETGYGLAFYGIVFLDCTKLILL